MQQRVGYLLAGVISLAVLIALVATAGLGRTAAQSQAMASPEACASPAASPMAKPSMTTPAMMASPMASPSACASPAASGASVTIEMVDIAFKPNAVTIPANTPVKVTLHNTGALPHNFSIDKLHISVNVDPGQTGEATINAPAGTYTFYCDVPGHREAGMFGTLTVK